MMVMDTQYPRHANSDRGLWSFLTLYITIPVLEDDPMHPLYIVHSGQPWRQPGVKHELHSECKLLAVESSWPLLDIHCTCLTRPFLVSIFKSSSLLQFLMVLAVNASASCSTCSCGHESFVFSTNSFNFICNKISWKISYAALVNNCFV